jgi:hypothetical protein
MSAMSSQRWLLERVINPVNGRAGNDLPLKYLPYVVRLALADDQLCWLLSVSELLY